ncbi:MAG: ParA family protein [Acutalibacteraceae bacterium]
MTMKTNIIAITYEKGGCGKTTTAVNLSAILADTGYKTLLVDLDKQAYSTSYYDLYSDDNPCILEVMQGLSPDKAIIKTDIENLFILPSNRRFKDIETILMMKTKRQEYTLKNALEPVLGVYDYIILDCPPSGERIKENALTYADYVIFPLIPDGFSVDGLLQMSQEILEVKKYTNPNISVMGILITLFENNKNKKEYTQAFRGQTLLPVFKTQIRKNTYLSEAINNHLPITKYKKNCNGAKDYLSFAAEVISKTQGGNLE